MTGEFDPAADPVPAADVTIRQGETEGGYAFEIEGELRAGPQMVEFVNEGEETHYIYVGRVPEGTTAEEMVAAFALGEGTPPPANGFDPAGMESVALTQTQSAGATQWQTWNLEPGTYALICFAFVADAFPELHAVDGELEVVTIA